MYTQIEQLFTSLSDDLKHAQKMAYIVIDENEKQEWLNIAAEIEKTIDDIILEIGKELYPTKDAA